VGLGDAVGLAAGGAVFVGDRVISSGCAVAAACVTVGVPTRLPNRASGPGSVQASRLAIVRTANKSSRVRLFIHQLLAIMAAEL
jgi:hypothetical protein